MKELMNRVTQAKRAAEASSLLAARKRPHARQANTAKLVAGDPPLIRLRELDVLEKVAANSNLGIVLGEKHLTNRVVKVL
jgi:hypothetical protein